MNYETDSGLVCAHHDAVMSDSCTRGGTGNYANWYVLESNPHYTHHYSAWFWWDLEVEFYRFTDSTVLKLLILSNTLTLLQWILYLAINNLSHYVL